MTRAVRCAPSGAAHVARAALVAAVLAGLGVFHVWSRTRVVSAGYALGKLQNEHVRLESEHDRLRIEVETLRSPATLERYARTKLGMAPPEPGAVSAAGPQLAEASARGAGRDGVDHLSGPAEPSLHGRSGRAAAAWPAAVSGGPLAFRSPLPADPAGPIAR